MDKNIVRWGAFGESMAGFGDTLQQARAHKGVTLKEAEQSTRINRQHLSALENEKFEALPPLIYQRGIVRNYAVYLDLDPARMLALFEEAHGAFAPAPARGRSSAVQAGPPVDMPSHWTPNFAIIAFSVVLGAIVFAWAYSAYMAPSDDAGTPTVAVPTMTPFTGDIALPTDPPVTIEPTKAATATTAPTTASDSAAIPGRGDNQRGQSQDNQADAPTATQAPATEAPTEPIVEPTTPPATEAPASDDLAARNQERQQSASASGTPLGGITITAQGQDLELTVTVDGTVEFQGVLPAGSTTDQFVGTNFQVSSSSGGSTVFTDACGNAFQISYEAGPASWSFPADGSCPPS